MTDETVDRTTRRPRVAILHGGISREREVSLQSGRAVAGALASAGFDVLPVEINPDGGWLLAGPQPDLLDPAANAAPTSPTSALPTTTDSPGVLTQQTVRPEQLPADVVFVALHGEFGEDGKVQGLLEVAGLPYTGSGVDASALAMDKVRTKEVLAHHGIRSAPWLCPNAQEWARDADGLVRRAEQELGFPIVVKPARDGSSFGLSLATDAASLRRDVEALLSDPAAPPGARALLERRIVGTEVSCPVVGNSGGPLRTLPIVEIVTLDGGLFDFAAKYEGASAEICPARIEDTAAAAVRAAAITAHRVLGCDGVSRSDFILDSDGVAWFLETNTIPGMTPASLCPLSAKTAGIEFEDFCRMLVELALQRSAR